MELSFFLAQLFGLTLMIFSALAIFRPVLITVAMRDLRPYSFVMLMAGFMAIIAGLAIILSHNIWEFSWRGVVTLFGWSALFKGISYVAFPDMLRTTASGVLKDKRQRIAVLSLAFLLGCYLAYHGFGLGF